MTIHILNDIPFAWDIEDLRRRLRVPERIFPQFMALFDEGRQIARPKAMYRPAYIEERTEEAILVEGQWFHSRVISVNVLEAHRIFLYAASCGLELDAWSKRQEDALKIFWAASIKEDALSCAINAVEKHVEDHYHPGKTAHQNPGSLADFPLCEQKALFGLLGDTCSAVGITLLPSTMMLPSHSVSGIIFPTVAHFESCMLCPREHCPGRRAAYDRDLYNLTYFRSVGETTHARPS